MSERSYTVWIKDITMLDFDEFYDKFLNKENEFEHQYTDPDNERATSILRGDMGELFDQATEELSYFSDTLLVNRHFTWSLAKYIATKGIPVKVRDIGGWDPMLVIHTGHNTYSDKCLKDPEYQLEDRFSYMVDWAKECGLRPQEMQR